MEKANTYYQRWSCAYDNVNVRHLLPVRSILCEALSETWSIGGMGV